MVLVHVCVAADIVSVEHLLNKVYQNNLNFVSFLLAALLSWTLIAFNSSWSGGFSRGNKAVYGIAFDPCTGRIQFDVQISCHAMRFWLRFWLIKNTSKVLILNKLSVIHVCNLYIKIICFKNIFATKLSIFSRAVLQLCSLNGFFFWWNLTISLSRDKCWWNEASNWLRDEVTWQMAAKMRFHSSSFRFLRVFVVHLFNLP